MRAIADTGETADTLFLVDAHDAALVAVDRVSRAHVDAFAALVAVGGNEGVVIVQDADGGIVAVVSFVIGLGTGFFARQTTGANFLSDGENFHG